MRVPRYNIIAYIHNFWPDLVDGHQKPGNIFIPRGEYWIPTKEHLERFIEQEWKRYIEAINYDIKLFACTNFAALFRSLIDIFVIRLVESNKLKYQDMLEWTVMTVWGTKFKGRETSHAINMILMEDGLWFFEPQQAHELWKADPENDKIHMVIM